MKNLVEIYFPIVPDFPLDNYDFSQKQLIISEINEILNRNDFKLADHIISYRVAVKIEDYDPRIGVLAASLDQIKFKEPNLKFTFEVESDHKKIDASEKKSGVMRKIIDEEQLQTLLPFSISEFFGNRIFELITLSQLARPGSLKLREGLIFVDKKNYSDPIQVIVNLRPCLEYQREKIYPQIEFMKLTSLHSWLRENCNLFTEKANNALEKGLNNFSYLVSSENEISRFIYQMRFIEAIYTEGISNISNQLDTKIQLFLGPLKSFKKQIKNMYAVRSRFVHGDMNIAPSHKAFEDHESVNKINDTIYDAQMFSMLLVISTLQKMILEKRIDLDFKYIIE